MPIRNLFSFSTAQTEKNSLPKLVKISDEFVIKLLSVLQYKKVSKILSDRHVMPEWSGWNRTKRAISSTIDFVQTAIDQHESNYNEDVKENPKDFIDAFLNQINDKANIG